MMKITNLNEIQKVTFPDLKAHIEQKVQGWIDEYGIESLDEIGCFVILDKSENQMFEVSDMEFVEVLRIKDETYLHGARILSDNFGNDIYLPVEVVKC